MAGTIPVFGHGLNLEKTISHFTKANDNGGDLAPLTDTNEWTVKKVRESRHIDKFERLRIVISR
jgi:hypothetical protein